MPYREPAKLSLPAPGQQAPLSLLGVVFGAAVMLAIAGVGFVFVIGLMGRPFSWLLRLVGETRQQLIGLDAVFAIALGLGFGGFVIGAGASVRPRDHALASAVLANVIIGFIAWRTTAPTLATLVACALGLIVAQVGARRGSRPTI